MCAHVLSPPLSHDMLTPETQLGSIVGIVSQLRYSTNTVQQFQLADNGNLYFCYNIYLPICAQLSADMLVILVNTHKHVRIYTVNCKYAVIIRKVKSHFDIYYLRYAPTLRSNPHAKTCNRSVVIITVSVLG